METVSEPCSAAAMQRSMQLQDGAPAQLTGLLATANTLKQIPADTLIPPADTLHEHLLVAMAQ